MQLNPELAILNRLMFQPDCQQYILEHCDSQFFTDVINRKIFESAKELARNDKPIDNIGVFYLNECKKEIGERIFDCAETEAYNHGLRGYCQMLFDRYLKKFIKNAKDIDDIKKVETLKERYSFEDSSIKSIGDDIAGFSDKYEQRKGKLLISGWDELDSYIGSFCGGDYIVLGGSTGTGKTSIALNFAKNLCMFDKHVLYCSLEMPLEQLQNRFNCMITGLNAMKYRSCGFTQDELKRYEDGLKTLNEWNLHVLCDYNLTVEKLRVYAEDQKREGLDFIIVDYLGLMSGYGNKSLYERVTEISRKLKILATDLNVPIMVLVQINRDIKNRQDKHPMLSDIRESGAIEQDADFVLFAYRDFVYNPESSPKELELMVAKNRHGMSNVTCNLEFDLQTQNITQKWGGFYG